MTGSPSKKQGSLIGKLPLKGTLQKEKVIRGGNIQKFEKGLTIWRRSRGKNLLFIM